MPDAGVHISVPLLYTTFIDYIVVHASHGQSSFCHCPWKAVLEAVNSWHQVQQNVPATVLACTVSLMNLRITAEVPY